MLTISYYKGGVAYYPVLIKHFGNTETPWTMPTGGVLESYPGTDAANNWLGRYGVLRNTWYTVNVTGLKTSVSAKCLTQVRAMTTRWTNTLQWKSIFCLGRHALRMWNYKSVLQKMNE